MLYSLHSRSPRNSTVLQLTDHYVISCQSRCLSLLSYLSHPPVSLCTAV